MTTSASSRSGPSSARSAANPSASRPPRCSGCSRRFASYRRISAGSDGLQEQHAWPVPAGVQIADHRGQVLGEGPRSDVDDDGDPGDPPRASPRARPWWRSVPAAGCRRRTSRGPPGTWRRSTGPPRTSRRRWRPRCRPDALPSSSAGCRSLGARGRGCVRFTQSLRPRARPRSPVPHLVRCLCIEFRSAPFGCPVNARRSPRRWPADAGDGGQLLDVAARSLATDPKCRISAVRLVRPRPGTPSSADTIIDFERFCPVIGDREPVRLVAQSLQQVQRLTGARQDHRLVLARHPDLLQPLGQSDHRDVDDASSANAAAAAFTCGCPPSTTSNCGG